MARKKYMHGDDLFHYGLLRFLLCLDIEEARDIYDSDKNLLLRVRYVDRVVKSMQKAPRASRKREGSNE